MDDIREFESRIKEQLDALKMARAADNQSVSSVSQSNASSSSMASSSTKQ